MLFSIIIQIQINVSNILFRLYQEEGEGIFTTRENVLGHMQQAGNTSPFDRCKGTTMAAKACNWLVQQLERPEIFDQSSSKVCTKDKNTVALLGLRSRSYQFQSVQDLKTETDFTYRRSKHVWWKQIRSIMRILAQYDSTYTNENVDAGDAKGVQYHLVDLVEKLMVDKI